MALHKLKNAGIRSGTVVRLNEPGNTFDENADYVCLYINLANDDEDSATEQPAQQSSLSTGISGGIATSIYDTHEFNAGDGVQNVFILILNEGHHAPKQMKTDF
jgi:hypothetical protein